MKQRVGHPATSAVTPSPLPKKDLGVILAMRDPEQAGTVASN
jgi:hypothetical protein